MSLSKTQMAGAALAFINLTTLAHAASKGKIPSVSTESSKILLSASTRALKIAGYSITGATLAVGGTVLTLLIASKFLTKKVDALPQDKQSKSIQSALAKVFSEIGSKGGHLMALTALTVAVGLTGASVGLRHGIKA
jgi:hypothetical protein